MNLDSSWRWQRPRKVDISENFEFRRDLDYSDRSDADPTISDLKWDFLGSRIVNPLKELPNGHRYYAQLYDQFRVSPTNVRSIGSHFFLKTGDLLDSTSIGVAKKNFDFCLSESAELWWVIRAMEALLNFGAPHTVSDQQGLISELDVINPMRIEERIPFVEPYRFYPAEQARLIQMADAARDVRYWPTLNLTVRYSMLLDWLVTVINRKISEHARPQIKMVLGSRPAHLLNVNHVRQAPFAMQKVVEVTTPINLCGYFWLCAAGELQSLGMKEYYRCKGFQRCSIWLSKRTGQRVKRLYCQPACRMAHLRENARLVGQTT